ILNLGISNFVDILYNNYKGFSFNTSNDSTMLFNIATGMIFVCLCAVVAIRVLIAILAVWFLMYAGIFILGFGSTSWTSDMAINYFRTVLVASIRLATIILIVGVCQNVIEDISPSTSSNNAYSPNNFLMMLELIVTALMMYLLIKTIPELLASLAKGILGSNTHQSNPANAYANALMNGYYAGGSAGGGGSSRSAAAAEAEQHAQRLAASLMAQHEAARAEERAAKVAYPKPESPKPSPTTSSSSHYMHGIDFANMKYPNPNVPPPGDSGDVGGPA
ncbi:MAG: type IV secretion system protein, partial [Acetobacter sp.]|nr:type IV secretion system protein [Acetobacter sp.]